MSGIDSVGDGLRFAVGDSGLQVDVDGRKVPLQFRRSPRAKRYRLFVDRLGRPRVTIPRRGTLYEARQFAAAHVDWLAGQLRRFAERSGAERIWVHGTEILFRGRLVALELPSDGTERALLLGAETIALPLGAQPERPEQGDLRAVVEAHLRRLADTELPGRALELAALHGCVVCEINVRNQRTRWGSCSRRGAVSLNWRLVQVPETVRDYIILHELMHLRVMSHSRKFWAEVERVCPGYRDCEAWLRAHSPRLL